MTAEYDASLIQVLKGLESVRRRPGMYIGSTGPEGLSHLLFEVIANALDQGLMGQATRISVSRRAEGWLVVCDDGPGFSMASRGDYSFAEYVLTHLSGLATVDGHRPHIHLAKRTWQLGLAVVSALSERLELEFSRDGHRYLVVTERGELTQRQTDLGRTTLRGSCLTFRPDRSLFEAAQLDLPQVRARCEELAWLSGTLTFELDGEAFHGTGGLVGWLVSRGASPSAVRHAHGTINDIDVDVAWAPWGQGPSRVKSFVNYRATRDGSHAQAFASALPTTGVEALIHVGLGHPRFSGPTQEVLHMPEARGAVAQLLANIGAWPKGRAVRTARHRDVLK